MSDHLPNLQYLKPEVLQKLGDLELIAREAVEGLRVGSHRSNLRGFSTEFAHHRQYSPGDEIRDLDWRVYGRTDRFYTKLYEAETNFDCHILMDASASMLYSSDKVSKLEYAKYMAAAMCYLVLNQRDSVGLSIFDSELNFHMPPRSTMGILLEIEKHLREVKPAQKDSLSKQLEDISLQIKRRSFVVLISDLFSNVKDVIKALDSLRFAGHNVVVFHTLDPYEINFPFKGTWKFEALENEDELITQPERIRDDYLTNFNRYLEELKAGCVASGVDYTMVDTSKPLDGVLSHFVQRRANGGVDVGARP